TGRATSGTFVIDPLPAPSVAWFEAAPAFELPPAVPANPPIPRRRDLLLMLGGVPDLRFLPHRALARAYHSALAGRSSRALLDYAEPQGNPRLRAALGELLSRTRGVQADPRTILVVRGSQEALYLTTRALLRPGEAVAVEAIGYPATRDVLRQAGVEVIPIPVDPAGMDVDALEATLERRPLRAVVVTPHHQYPTTVTLSQERRARLLALARRHHLVVIEDDYDFEFHYDVPPVLPLASVDPGPVVYVGTLSKTLAPGLRLGWVVAHPEVVERLTAYRSLVDQQGDHVLEQAVALMLEDGDVQRHTRRAARAYRARRDHLCGLLRDRLPQLEFTPPAGGMAVWARAPGIDVDPWAARGHALGVAFQSGRGFWADPLTGRCEHLRVGFAACDEQEMDEAVARMVQALPPEAR
ncbi:MAG: PLP-dependent aminotransferase family protein, partial [Myxococcota bacterium]